MNRRHGLFLAVAIGLAAIAGTYAALQTTDLGAQAATVSEQEIAAADLRLDKQEAALRRAAKKRSPRLPKLPAKASGTGAAAPAGAAAAPALAAAPPSGSVSSGPSSNSGPGGWDDDFDDDDSGHGGGGDDDFDDDDFDDDNSGHGGGGDDD